MTDPEALRRALASLATARSLLRAPPMPDEALRAALRDSVIQRFEYSYELAVRLIQRALRERAAAPEEIGRLSFGDLMRSAAAAGLVDDPVAWMDFRAARNRTSHAYDEQQAEAVLAEVPRFADAAQTLVGRLAS